MTPVDPGGHICVVGGSLAASTAAANLRTSGHRGRITMISDEDTAPYARPPLSKSILSGSVSSGSVLLAPPSGVDIRLSSPAAGLDLRARELSLADGSTVRFDGLVVATGAKARRLAGGSDDVATLRSLCDAKRLREAMRSATTMIVVGAGPLAMEIASTGAELGIRVTVVSNALPLRAHLGARLAGILLRYAQDAGVEVVVDAQKCRLSRSAEGRTVVVSADLQSRSADLVCVAVGCTPNIEWLAGSGLEVGEHGLLVDECLSAADGVVAAGDVVGMRCPTGEVHREPLWSNAIDQAMLAASNLLSDRPQRFRFRPSFWTELFGHKLRVVGTVREEAELSVESYRQGFIYRWLSPQGAVEAAAALDVPMSIRRLRELISGPATSCCCYA
jgi:3-phenylpropionate/trans-cinnamate dioxygenase ferredoxin reductase component